MAEPKKNDWRRVADYAAAYGHCPEGTIGGYERFVGLWLNLPRARSRRSWDLMVGASWAASTERLPRQSFEDQVDAPAEADELQLRTNSRRG